MENEEYFENNEEIKNKVKDFFSDKQTLIFVLILVIGIAIRLYFFSITKSQPLWWDEADYMAFAKNIAGIGGVDWIVTAKHNSLFPFIAAIFLKFTTSEPVLRFILEVLPSIFLIFLTYKLLILMYSDKRIALISSFLMATFWNVLFNSFRFHLGVPALIFAFLAIYVFWQGYEKKQKIFGKINPKYTIPLTVLLVLVVYAIRQSYFLFGIFFLFYMLSTRKIKTLIKDKYNWISLLLVAGLFFIFDKFVFISKTAESSGIAGTLTTNFDFVPLQIFGVYFQNLNNPTLSILTYLFWIGFFLLAAKIFLYFGNFKKQNNLQLKADLFHFLSIAITIIFFFFLVRDGELGDPRWYFPLLLGSFVCISKAGIFISDYIKKYNKEIAIGVLIVLLAFGGYYQYQHADMIIKAKAPSYQGIKDASLYLKEISSVNDVIISVPVPQTAYYSERSSLSPSGLFNNEKTHQEISLEDFLNKLRETPDVKYIIVSFSEPGHPSWMRNESAEFVQDPQTGQIKRALLQIPFMDTKIDFVNQIQDVKQSKTYDDLTFKLINTNQDSFVYEIQR